MAESYLGNEPAASSSADRYQVMVHVTAETSRRLCCDASISRVVEDAAGEPISIGRKSRVIPAPMRRALRARDKGCRFAGCTHRHLLDGHHIRHWADGGETKMDNLALLCRFHHRLVHEEAYVCACGADGRLKFQPPDGTAIPASGYTPPVAGAFGVRRLRQRLEHRHIDHRSCVSLWDGGRMDRDLAVQLLWHKTHLHSVLEKLSNTDKIVT